MPEIGDNMKRCGLLFLLGALAAAQPTTTTQYVGTVRDLTGAIVTSGRITWQSNAPAGTVIPGTGSFVSTTVSCQINATGNPVASSDGTSPCLITNNTALTPTGTSYTMCTQPYNVSPGSCIVTYATGGAIDISTIVPTPTTGPFNFSGTPGPPGPANALAIGTVTTIPAGGSATATITGTPPSQTLNMGLVTGDTGLTGSTGATGSTGPPGPTGPPGGSLSYPGVTSNGANGLNIAGQVSSPTYNVAGSTAARCIHTDGSGNLATANSDCAALVATTTPVPTAQMPTSGWTAQHGHGDSVSTIAATCGAATPSDCYMQRLNTLVGSPPLTNYAVSGTTMCDMVIDILNHENPGATSTVLQTLMGGTNDANFKGTGLYEYNYIGCGEAAIAALTSPSTLRADGSNTTPATNWSTDTTFSAITGLQSSTNGAAQTWSYTLTVAGQGVCLLYRVFDGGTGVFQFADSANASIGLYLNAYTNPAIASGGGATSGVFAYCPVPSPTRNPGTYTITTTVRAAGTVSIMGVFVAPPALTGTTPAVWQGGVIRQRQPESLPKQLATFTYDRDARNMCNEMFNLGFGCFFVDTRSYMTSTPAEMSAASPTWVLHPGSAGHAELSQAFIGATGMVRTPANAVPVTIPPFSDCSHTVSAYPVTLAQTDTCVVFTGAASGTITLPAELPLTQIGQQIVLSNPGSGYITVAGGPNATLGNAAGIIAPGVMWTVKYTLDKRWMVQSIAPNDPTQLSVTAVIGATYQMLCSDQFIYASAATAHVFTFPAAAAACPLTKIIHVTTIGSGISTFTGAGTGNGANVVLSAGTGAEFWQLTAGNWWIKTQPAYSAISASVGGSALTAGQCASGTASVAGSTTSQVAVVSPNTYPGDGFEWHAYVSAAGTVTVKVCAELAGTPTASTYNVRVIQ